MDMSGRLYLLSQLYVIRSCLKRALIGPVLAVVEDEDVERHSPGPCFFCVRSLEGLVRATVAAMRCRARSDGKH